jgi:hypothetical protein
MPRTLRGHFGRGCRWAVLWWGRKVREHKIAHEPMQADVDDLIIVQGRLGVVDIVY